MGNNGQEYLFYPVDPLLWREYKEQDVPVDNSGSILEPSRPQDNFSSDHEPPRSPSMSTAAEPKTLTPIEMTGVQTRLTAEEEQTLLRVLREATSLATGPEGEAFEKEFAEFLGCEDAVAVNSCSSALELAAILSELQEGDEVIIPAHTFCATAVPFGRTGATIKWADIEPDTRVISADSIQSLVTPRTKVVIVVHLYGMPADMDAIMKVADSNDLIVVEDCAQAPGARYKGRCVGSIGHFGCFSFHTHKNITTLGEGGMLAVRDKSVGRSARRLRWMGNWPFEEKRERYWLPAMGNVVQPMPGHWPHNFCLGEPNSAVGRMLIKRLDALNQQRRDQADRFRGYFKDFPELVFQSVPDGYEHAYHLMSARYDGQKFGKTRDDLMELLHSKYNVKMLIQYWPLNRTDLYQQFGFGQASVPESDRFFDNMISFPWWSDMGDQLVDELAQRTCRALQDMREA